MLTYQDLLAVGENEKERIDFVRKAISAHKSSDMYKVAYDADQYCRHKNVTIINYQKILYTVTGRAVPDNWSANFKMASRFFHRFVTQENQFLLGNGVTFVEDTTKGKLGNERYPFDNQMQKAGKDALVMGVSFGFFNLDHLEVFDLLEFVPIYDEEDGALKAGIRFWQVDSAKPMRATLYELDGYTDYIWNRKSEKNDLEGAVLHEKRPYKLKIRQTEADGMQIYDAENYPGFPIVPLWANTHHQSEFVGLREQIDCYDLIKSGFANTVDEASIVYWTLTNAGGMDDVDLAKFVERLKTVHAATIDDQVQAQSHTSEPPFNSREALLTRLEKDLYKDAMALNTEAIAAGAVTATQIRAAYEPLNSKTDDFEYCVIEFIKGILSIAGIQNEQPTFTRSMIVNVAEEVQTVMQAASYLDSEYVTRKILTILGDGDKADEVLENIQTDDMSRFNAIEDRLAAVEGANNAEIEEAEEGLGGAANR